VTSEPGRFLERCQSALSEQTPELAVKDLVAEIVSRPSGVRSALGAPSEAGLSPLYRSEHLTVLKVLWAPGMELYPHERRMWAVIGIYGGRGDNAFFRRTEGQIAAAGGKHLEDFESALSAPPAVYRVFT
jgi:predicted metal-dependent enzyme (double-stranded beta helix superfamily)